MKEIPYTNTKPHAVTIGTKTIAPGDTRMVDETLVRATGRTPAVDEAPSDPLLEALDDSIANIAAKLPEFSDDELERLIQGEADGKTRKGLMSAFEEEKLRRAQAATAETEEGGAGEEGGTEDETEGTESGE